MPFGYCTLRSVILHWWQTQCIKFQHGFCIHHTCPMQSLSHYIKLFFRFHHGVPRTVLAIAARSVGTAFCAHACAPKTIVKSNRFPVHSRGHDDPAPTLPSVLESNVSTYAPPSTTQNESKAITAFDLRRLFCSRHSGRRNDLPLRHATQQHRHARLVLVYWRFRTRRFDRSHNTRLIRPGKPRIDFFATLEWRAGCIGTR